MVDPEDLTSSEESFVDSEDDEFEDVVAEIVNQTELFKGENREISEEEANNLVYWLGVFDIASIFELLEAMGGCGHPRQEIGETQKWVETLPFCLHVQAVNSLRTRIISRRPDMVELGEVQTLLQSIYFPGIEEVLNPSSCTAPLDVRQGLYLITRTPPTSICLVRPNVKAQLSRIAYPTLPPTTKPYTIAPSTKGGQGMFATRSIQEDELVLVERPMVVLPDMLVFLDPDLHPNADDEEMAGSMLDTYRESILQTMLNLDPDIRQAFESLSHCHSTGNRLSDIFQTNAMLLTDLVDEDRAGVDERGSGHGGVFKEASRLNHSCVPNVKIGFDLETFALKLRASRNVEAGEELCFMYAGSQVESTKARRALLERHWAFLCDCKRCISSDINP